MVGDKPAGRMHARSLVVVSGIIVASALSVAFLSVSRWWDEQIAYGRLHVVWRALSEYENRHDKLPDTGHEVSIDPARDASPRRSWRASLANDVSTLLDRNSLEGNERAKADEDEGRGSERARESCVFAPRGGDATILAICSVDGGWLASEVHNARGSLGPHADPALLIECRSMVVGCYVIEDVRSTPSGLIMVVNGVDHDASLSLSGARVVRQSDVIEVIPENLSPGDLHNFFRGEVRK